MTTTDIDTLLAAARETQQQIGRDLDALAERLRAGGDNLVSRRQEQRISELLGQRAAAETQLRMLSDRLVRLEAEGARVVGARLHLNLAIRALQGVPQPMSATGCHPKLQQRSLARETTVEAGSYTIRVIECPHVTKATLRPPGYFCPLCEAERPDPAPLRAVMKREKEQRVKLEKAAKRITEDEVGP